MIFAALYAKTAFYESRNENVYEGWTAQDLSVAILFRRQTSLLISSNFPSLFMTVKKNPLRHVAQTS